jgi:hypothetical protein
VSAYELLGPSGVRLPKETARDLYTVDFSDDPLMTYSVVRQAKQVGDPCAPAWYFPLTVETAM